MFAIVDIETTGSVGYGNRIIEVAIVLHDGKKVESVYETLINPGTHIPAFITRLTGINADMIKNAPSFDQVIDEIEKLTAGRVFVAHNVQFDYSFIQSEFKTLGRHFYRKKLCTVKLGRRLIKNQPSYSLGNICSSLGIKIANRHRAAGDALATAELLTKLIEADTSKSIEETIRKQTADFLIPMHIDREKINSLPEQEGVYYFLDHKGRTIYIGKANNIRKRVLNHFNSNSETRQKGFLVAQIHDIKFVQCGNELVSLVLEASEIKRVWPKYNYALKNPPARFGLKMYEDRAGYLRIGVKKLTKFEDCLKEFRSLTEGREYMKEAAKQFNLCDTLCNLQTAPGPCNGVSDSYCNGPCHGEESHKKYNKRVSTFHDEIKYFAQSYIVVGKGRETDEKAFIFIEQNKLKGYGFFPSYNQYIEPELLRIHLQPLPHNEQVLRMVESFWAHEDYEIVEFESNETEQVSFDGIGLFALI